MTKKILYIITMTNHPPVVAWSYSWLMFVVVIAFCQIHPFFGEVQRLMFLVVKFRSSSNIKVRVLYFFQSNSNQFLVILIWSSELASFKLVLFNDFHLMLPSRLDLCSTGKNNVCVIIFLIVTKSSFQCSLVYVISICD